MAAGDAGFGDTGRGLEGHTEHQRVAVGNAAVHAAGMVGHRGLGMFMTAAAVVLAAVFVLAMALALMPFLMAFAMAAVVLLTFFVVVPAAALVLREGVVVLAALHAGSGKAVSELNATDAGDGEYGMGNQGFHAVPESSRL